MQRTPNCGPFRSLSLQFADRVAAHCLVLGSMNAPKGALHAEGA